MVDDPHRRQFLSWAGAVGLTAVAPDTVAEVAEAQSTSASESQGPSEDVILPHVTGYDGVQARMTTAANEDRPEAKYGERLSEAVRSGEYSTYDLLVRTLGESVTVTSERYGRTINGWRPTDDEVRRLDSFGDVRGVPEVSSTTVSLLSVDESDLAAVADLPFVATVDYRPTPGLSRQLGGTPCPTQPTDAETARSDAGMRFAEVQDDYAIESPVKCGILDDGYQGGEYSHWDRSYAEPYLDHDLANSWTGESWQKPDDPHGDNVTDTIAYMLGEGWDDLYVPLRVNGNEDVNIVDNARMAIEYALKHDIDVLNMSIGWSRDGYCNSTVCAELASYVAAGYVPVASSGNTDTDQGATEPAASLFSVGVGGARDEGDDGCQVDDPDSAFTVYDGSSHGDVAYDGARCEICADRTSDASQFVPDVYGIGSVHVSDRSCPIAGTSIATPQVAAAAVIMQSNELHHFWTAKQICSHMDSQGVCPPESVERGGLNDAELAHRATK